MRVDGRYAKTKADRQEMARGAYEWLLKAQEREGDEGKDRLLDELAVGAYEAGEMDAARLFAQRMLENVVDYWEPSIWIYEAHRILGHLAFDRGDFLQAADCLALAGAGVTVFRFRRGPTLSLAQVFLEKGEREMVAEHLRTIRKVWSPGWEKVDGWLEQLANGQQPNLIDSK
ncbi:MAG: hypothetical protein V3V20_01280 [Algisphaera sp.]